MSGAGNHLVIEPPGIAEATLDDLSVNRLGMRILSPSAIGAVWTARKEATTGEVALTS